MNGFNGRKLTQQLSLEGSEKSREGQEKEKASVRPRAWATARGKADLRFLTVVNGRGNGVTENDLLRRRAGRRGGGDQRDWV